MLPKRIIQLLQREAFDHSKRVLMMESEMKRADSERRRMEFWFIS